MVNTTKLNINILVEPNISGGATASVLEMPVYRVEAATREQALEDIQALLAARLQNVEVVSVELTLPQSNPSENSWLQFAGFFKDDSDFADIAAKILAERETSDETEVDPALYTG
jgi:hypothetical protein